MDRKEYGDVFKLFLEIEDIIEKEGDEQALECIAKDLFKLGSYAITKAEREKNTKW